MSTQEYSFLKSQKGKPKLEHEGHFYCYTRENQKGVSFWKCETRPCKGTVTISQDQLLTVKSGHDHAPLPHKLEVLKMKENMLDIASQSQDTPRAILNHVQATISWETAVRAPQKKSLQRAIQRKRTKGLPNPRSLEQIDIPVELQQTLRGSPFLAFDSGCDDPERFLVFTTTENLDLLENLPVWQADGTFKSSPSLFYQIYTIHGVFREHTIPLIFILLARKTEELYIRAFREIVNLNSQLNPMEIITDFEKASINAFKEVFPMVQIKGCFFHFAQANWRKLQELGLSKPYRECEEIRIVAKCVISLAIIPEEDVFLGFDQLVNYNKNDILLPYFEYFEETWLGVAGRLGRRSAPQYPVTLWNQFENAKKKERKTNNSVEAFHSAFQVSMGCAHPTLMKFIEFLRLEQSASENKIARIRCGETPIQSKKYKYVSEKLAELLKHYQNNNIVEQLKGITASFDLF